MKKLFAIILVLFAGGCGNMDIVETTFTFKTAYIKWPDGSVKILKLTSWRYYAGKQYQLKDNNGNVYLVSAMNVILSNK